MKILPYKDYQGLVLTRQELRQCDLIAQRELGLSGLVLMENAGIGAARVILDHIPIPPKTKPSKTQTIEGKQLTKPSPTVCVVAGPGNNGGDGFVVARHLTNAGIDLTVLLIGSPDRLKGDALTNYNTIERMGLPIFSNGSNDPLETAQFLQDKASKALMIVDAILGTGASGPVRQPYLTAINTINSLQKRVVALDIPSGLDCDTGDINPTAIKAYVTVTFAALKKAFLTAQGQTYTGPVTMVPIGIDARLLIKYLRK